MLLPGDDVDVGKPSPLVWEGAPHRIHLVLGSRCRRYYVIWVVESEKKEESEISRVRGIYLCEVSL